MNDFVRLFLALCIFAGFGTGMAHGFTHGEKDACAAHCDSGSHEKQSQDGHDEHGSVPHHHTCCHHPSADRATDPLALRIGFECVLVEIAPDSSLVPDEPVFALDKPPLI